jgi:hypothetical protein
MPSQLLDRSEYIEQAYFFRAYRERLQENVPSQEILKSVYEEILTTTKLPMAIEFLKGEILLTGRISDGMARLSHYFTAFQTFVMAQAEADRSKFDQPIGLKVLEREAEYRAGSPTPSGLFIYQFECIARNRLGYDRGMTAMADDPLYNDDWREWILKTRLQLGTVDFAEILYRRSEHSVVEYRRRMSQPDFQPPFPILFGEQEGRIAKANIGKDPLFMFAALQRQLGYPGIPRAVRKPSEPILHPAVEQRLQRMEKRLTLLESETKGGLDLSKFYVAPVDDDEKKDKTL